MNALCALAAAGYPTALELHHPPRGSAQSAQLQAFAVQAGFLGLVVISEQLRTEILRLLPNLDPASVLVAHDGARGDRLHEPKLRNGERTRVLYCGSLHPGKGVETLIAAAQQCPDYAFHEIGRASCGRGVGQYVYVTWVAVTLKKQ